MVSVTTTAVSDMPGCPEIVIVYCSSPPAEAVLLFTLLLIVGLAPPKDDGGEELMEVVAAALLRFVPSEIVATFVTSPAVTPLLTVTRKVKILLGTEPLGAVMVPLHWICRDELLYVTPPVAEEAKVTLAGRVSVRVMVAFLWPVTPLTTIVYSRVSPVTAEALSTFLLMVGKEVSMLVDAVAVFKLLPLVRVAVATRLPAVAALSTVAWNVKTLLGALPVEAVTVPDHSTCPEEEL